MQSCPGSQLRIAMRIIQHGFDGIRQRVRICRLYIHTGHSFRIDPTDSRTGNLSRHYRLSAGHCFYLYNGKCFCLPDGTQTEQVASPEIARQFLIADKTYQFYFVRHSLLFNQCLQAFLKHSFSANQHHTIITQLTRGFYQIFESLVSDQTSQSKDYLLPCIFFFYPGYLLFHRLHLVNTDGNHDRLVLYLL